ncbi:hypothetical protein ROLI_025460 [Roseobacter fucihabitans]|uniref:Uncharacterized protein n=1 Tax=Roseobacter fucihabitans TaxID=1537242 RepID=A0ABZ2BVU1_9RHOB|nr:hypothetical protein [Roseobacter litoralis]MBC6967627.1 hypothetical protein [Roseobacter litoralis]
MSEKEVNELLFIQNSTDDLIEKRKAWEEGSYKRSNEELYALLSDCLKFYFEIVDDVSKSRALNSYLRMKEIEFKDGTSLATRIVRAVFNSNFQKRAYTYARVITVAAAEMKRNHNLSDFITARGGVDEIRRAKPDGKSPAEVRRERIEEAKEALSSNAPLAEPFNFERPVRESDKGADHKLFVAIMRQEPNGVYSMVYETSAISALNTTLEIAGKDKDFAEIKKSAEERQRENEFINANAVELAAKLTDAAEADTSAA